MVQTIRKHYTSHLGYFTRIAERRWKAFVPTGSLCLQLIGESDADETSLLDYITKEVRRDVLHSSMLLPVS